MKILFIGKRFYTNRDALEERFGRIYQLPDQWAKAGHDTRLWLIDYHTSTSKSVTEQTLQIHSTSVFRLALFKELFRSVFHKEKPDVIVASGDTYIGLLGYGIAKLLNIRFIFDIYDKYDEWSGYRRLPLFDPLTFLQRKSATLLFASRALAETVNHSEKIICPNGIDTTSFFPRDMQECRHALSQPTDPIFIGYFGSMEPERGIEDLIAAIKQLRINDKRIELLLGGKKPDHIDVTQEGVRYLGNIDFKKVPLALGCCNILALPYRNSAFLDMASSCKIAEYIASAVPIVTTRTPNIVSNFPDQAEALNRFMPEPQNVTALASAILLQLEEKVLVEQPPGMTWKEIAEATLAQMVKTDTRQN